MRNVDLTKVHYLSGPFEIEGAKPGDILLVEIMDVQPFEDRPWGFTGIFDKKNGGGFLDEHYPSAYSSPTLYPLLIPHRLTQETEQRQSGISKASSAPADTSPM